MSMESARLSSDGAERARVGNRPILDRVLGLVGGGMILLAIVLMFIGGEQDGASAIPVATPALDLVQPRHGVTLRTDNLVVVFRVDGELRQLPGGWGTDSLHLHLNLDGTEVMPTAMDIERVSGDLFRWTLPRPEAGLHTVQLVWSGSDHRPVPGSGSRTVQIKVEE